MPDGSGAEGKRACGGRVRPSVAGSEGSRRAGKHLDCAVGVAGHFRTRTKLTRPLRRCPLPSGGVAGCRRRNIGLG